MIKQFTHPKISEGLVDKLKTADFREQMVTYDGNGIFNELESLVAEQLGVKYCLTTNSGTSALLSSYAALGLGQGDVVLAPVFNYFASVTPLKMLGATIQLVDVDSTGNIDIHALKHALETSKSVKAVSVTHMWGLMPNICEIRDLCRARGVNLIEDASHAHFSTCDGMFAGTFGDVAAFSLGAKKLFTGGQGGMLVTNSREVYEKALLIGHANHRCKREIELTENIPFRVTGSGCNFRMHPFAAASLIEQFLDSHQQISDRKAVYKIYEESFQKIPGITIHATGRSRPSGYTFPFHLEDGFSQDSFIDRAIEYGAFSIDRPGSTRSLLDFALFHDDYIPGDKYQGCNKYQSRLFKLDTFYGNDAVKIAKQHVDAIKQAAIECG